MTSTWVNLCFDALPNCSSKSNRKSLREYIVMRKKQEKREKNFVKSEKVAEGSYICFAYIICEAFGSIKESL